MSDEWHYTGVKMTPGQIEEVKRMHSQPYLVVAGRVPKSPEQLIHELALEHGLPDVRGYYGALGTGEFVCLKSSVGTTPDQFSSRKLEDIL